MLDLNSFTPHRHLLFGLILVPYRIQALIDVSIKAAIVRVSDKFSYSADKLIETLGIMFLGLTCRSFTVLIQLR